VHSLTRILGRFFGNSFGEAAHVFGRRHVEKILETYVNMQKELFGSDLHTTSVIKGFLKDRFNTANVPDAFLYFPEELGGLGIRNPFIRLFLVRDRLQESAEIEFECFEEEELSVWSRQKQHFDDCTEKMKLVKAKETFSNIKDTPDLDKFMSVEEYKARRLTHNSEFLSLYKKLISVPGNESVQMSSAVRISLGGLEDELDDEILWLIELHHKDLIKDFGGMQLVPKKFLPLAVLKMMRDQTVAWRMVI
jgi:hypothetical protein